MNRSSTQSILGKRHGLRVVSLVAECTHENQQAMLADVVCEIRASCRHADWKRGAIETITMYARCSGLAVQEDESEARPEPETQWEVSWHDMSLIDTLMEERIYPAARLHGISDYEARRQVGNLAVDLIEANGPYRCDQEVCGSHGMPVAGPGEPDAFSEALWRGLAQASRVWIHVLFDATR